MNTLSLTFTLASDALFGRGDGVAGLVDAEVQHDSLGCPFLGGRALKGQLVEVCADILAALPSDQTERWNQAAHFLFGRPGSSLDDSARMTVGDARLPADLRAALKYQVEVEKTLRPEQVLDSLTTLRRQTAIEEEGISKGVAKDASLRTSRVILRCTPFEAMIDFAVPPSADALALLAACARGFRRAGTHVNRGFGCLRDVDLQDSTGQSILESSFIDFRTAVLS